MKRARSGFWGPEAKSIMAAPLLPSPKPSALSEQRQISSIFGIYLIYVHPYSKKAQGGLHHVFIDAKLALLPSSICIMPSQLIIKVDFRKC